ncbi:MAG: GGDEF domain-containing protein [Negativicutes bacterium]|nr:GGDEF domain-containing protein [Negativicutes bacterium]
MVRSLLEGIRFNTFWNMAAICSLIMIFNAVAPQLNLAFNPGNFLSMHSILEFISVLIALSICTIVGLMWEGFDDYCGKFVMLFGLSFFAVGIVDIIYTLSYNGMPAFITPSSQEKAIFFWLYSRYLVAIGFLAALVWPKENGFCLRKAIYLFGAFSCVAIIAGVLLGTKFIELVPPLYKEPDGLTALKIHLEYILIAVYILEGFLLWTIRFKLSESVLKNLLYFFLFSVFSELTLIFDENLYAIYSLLGHIYKVGACYFLFKAVYMSGVVNHFYTLGEMGKMSAELLKEQISLEAVLEIQMRKLKKLVPQAQQICVHLVANGQGCYRTVYSWGKFSELFPVGGEFCLVDNLNHSMHLFTEPASILQTIPEGNFTPAVSVILKASKQLLRIPLVTKDALHGVILLFTFNEAPRFTPTAMEKATVFQQFATLAIAQATNQAIILKLSLEDSLTGLPNRRRFFEELSKLHYEADQYGFPFTVVYLDMNDLKYINDNLGHDAGDRCLEEIGRVLKQEARLSDVPARLGGDEFAILFRYMGLIEAEEKVAELKESFSRLPLSGYDHVFSLAVGGASYPEEADSAKNLLSLADDRMYEHKRQIKAKRITE